MIIKDPHSFIRQACSVHSRNSEVAFSQINAVGLSLSVRYPPVRADAATTAVGRLVSPFPISDRKTPCTVILWALIEGTATLITGSGSDADPVPF
jgi:hypothetical protein